MTKGSRILVVEYWFPLLVWMAVIYFFSTDTFAAGETSRIIVPLLRFFFPGLTMHEMEMWHGVMRKFGHISEYFILGALAYRSFRYDEPDLIKAKLLTGGFFLLVALSDEFHQLLTVSRGASLIDVGYDCLGGVWALWLITVHEIRRLRPYSVL